MIQLIDKNKRFEKHTLTVRIYKQACVTLLSQCFEELRNEELELIEEFCNEALDETLPDVSGTLIVKLSALCDCFPNETVRWKKGAKRLHWTKRSTLIEKRKVSLETNEVSLVFNDTNQNQTELS